MKNGVTTTAGEEAWDKHASSTLCNFRTDSLEDIILEHGVPTSRRAGLWFQWSGAEEKKCNALEENITYSTYIHQDIPKKVRQQIALDLPRTCPKHPAFECMNPEEDDESKQIVGPGRTAIGNVLRAYAARNNELGYLQSMNFLAAMLYLVLDGDEDRMFWMLTTIVEDILPGYFTARLHKLLENVDAFSVVLEQLYPNVAAKLEEHGLNISFRAPTWFLCMYFTSLKSEMVARVWDVVFFNVGRCPEGMGGPAALCCVGLGIVDSVADDIARSSNIADAAKALQGASDIVLDARKLVTRSFRDISTVAAMAQRLASPAVRLALKKQRDEITERRAKRSMTSRKPKRKRHTRSLSDGCVPAEFGLSFKEETTNPMNSPNTNAQIVERNKKRRRLVRRSKSDSTSSSSSSSSSSSTTTATTSSSVIATFKRWLTPKKAAAPAPRRAPPATAQHVRRMNFNGTPHRRQPRFPTHMIVGTPSGGSSGTLVVSVDSPRGDFELKPKTTPAKIRARALNSTGYGTPPGTPT